MFLLQVASLAMVSATLSAGSTACTSVRMPTKTLDLMVTSTGTRPSPPVVRLSVARITMTVEGVIGGFRSRTGAAQTTLPGPVWIGTHPTLVMTGLALGECERPTVVWSVSTTSAVTSTGRHVALV